MRRLIKSILFGISLFCSCQTQQNIVGKYTIIQQGKYPKIIPVTFYIELNKDSTFTYKFESGFHGKISTGFWKTDKEGKLIIINSFIQDISNIPLLVSETKGNNLHPLFVFDNPLKMDTSVTWMLNVNDTNYLLNTDSLVLDKEIVVKSFYLNGRIALADNTYVIPIPLHNTIQSKEYIVGNTNSNVYHISFPSFVDYRVFHYKPLKDSLILDRKMLLFEENKLKKEKSLKTDY